MAKIKINKDVEVKKQVAKNILFDYLTGEGNDTEDLISIIIENMTQQQIKNIFENDKQKFSSQFLLTCLQYKAEE